jgi:hypothetical protein
MAAALPVSFAATILLTENLPRIPLRIIFPRALGGLGFFLIIWLPICRVVYHISAQLFPSLDRSVLLRLCWSLILGLFLPHIGQLKDLFLPPALSRYFSPFQLIDEQTRLYIARIIEREERKISTVFFLHDMERRLRALDRLFEVRSLEIARAEAHKHKGQPDTVLGILKVRYQPVKFKYLLEFLGYTECLRALRLVAEKPGLILPSWPPDQGDRRRGVSADTSVGPLTLGRRKYEQAHTEAYVLGLEGTQLKRKFQVFVSSTFLDLKEERQRVLRALLCSDCIPSGMEFFPSSDDELLLLIHDMLDECDYYLLLIGSRYGTTTREGISYTEAEYNYAVDKNKPVVVLIQAVPPPSTEGAEQIARLEEFKKRVRAAHAPGYWNSPDEILLLVSQAIERLKKKHTEGGWIRYVRHSAGPGGRVP